MKSKKNTLKQEEACTKKCQLYDLEEIDAKATFSKMKIQF